MRNSKKKSTGFHFSPVSMSEEPCAVGAAECLLRNDEGDYVPHGPNREYVKRAGETMMRSLEPKKQ